MVHKWSAVSLIELLPVLLFQTNIIYYTATIQKEWSLKVSGVQSSFRYRLNMAQAEPKWNNVLHMIAKGYLASVLHGKSWGTGTKKAENGYNDTKIGHSFDMDAKDWAIATNKAARKFETSVIAIQQSRSLPAPKLCSTKLKLYANKDDQGRINNRPGSQPSLYSSIGAYASGKS